MRSVKMLLPAMVFLMLSVGLTQAQSSNSGPRILAIGDSLMAWNINVRRSIPQVVSQILKEPVQSRANVGAFMIYNLPISGALGKRISAQFRPGDMAGKLDWVIVTGGGNDLWLGCGCSRCEARMNKMISKNGTSGAVPKLMADIRASKAKVVFIGYLRSPGVKSTIDHCRDEGAEYERRLTQMAKRMNGVYFLSNADLVPNGDTSFHFKDRIHPSQKGCIAIGKRVANLIRRADPSRR